MANNYGSKLRTIYLKDYLEKCSDINHPVSMREIMAMLADHEIYADRKTIYSDIITLREEYNMDIVKVGYKYYLSARDFELEEIKILIDMVQSSNFITEKKTAELVSKLENQVSIYEGSNLSRRIYVRNRIKAKNESVYINVDKISEAITTDREIKFQYFRYNIHKDKELSHKGKIHEISPFALIWVDQNYYMLGYDSEHVEMRHYRVDRMTNISVTKTRREGKQLFEKTDMSTYTNKVFYMFTGEETTVKIRCSNFVIDSIMDRFGEDVIIVPDGDSHFIFSANVVVSTQFFAWLSPFGRDAEVLAPPNVRKMMYDHFSEITGMYE